MKTVLELAKELNVSKQKLYRHIKKNYINEVHHDAGVIHISDAVEKCIKQDFSCDEVHQEPHHEAHQTTSNDALLIQSLQEQIEHLKAQLNGKDEQISKMQELLNNQQVLTLQATKKIELLENKEPEEQYEKTWFGFYKKK